MFTPATLEVLRKLNKTELKRFGEFLKTPFFNSVEILGKLYDETVRALPDLNKEKLSYRIMFEKLYPAKEYKEQTIKNLYSEFGLMLKKYLAVEQVILNEDLLTVNLIRAYTKKKSFHLNVKLIKSRNKKSKASFEQDIDEAYFDFVVQKEYTDNLVLNYELDFPEILHSLNAGDEKLINFFLTFYYKYGYTRSAILNTTNLVTENNLQSAFDSSFDIKKFLAYFDSIDNKKIIYIKLDYLLAHYTKTNITKDEYFELKKLILTNLKDFFPWTKFRYLSVLIEILIVKLIPRDRSYYKEAFEIAKIFCGEKIFSDKNVPYMQTATLRNIVVVALFLREYKWAENFVDEYVNYIDDDLRENELHYNKGILLFKYEKFQESLNHFSKVTIHETSERLNVKFYYVMNYIELESYTLAISTLKAIRQFYKESKEIPARVSELVEDSLKYLSEIIRCVKEGKEPDAKLIEEAKSDKRYYHKRYIVEKLSMLTKRKK